MMWKLVIFTAALCSLHIVTTNGQPSLDYPSSIPVQEDRAINSTLFHINVTNFNGELTFAMTSSTENIVRYGEKNESGNFVSIEVVLNTELDRDYSPSTENLVFSVQDLSYPTTATVLLIIIDVNDEPPRFQEPGYRVSVKESETIGSKVSQVSATDPDNGLGGRVYYGLKAKGQSPGDYIHTFIIDKNEGKISVNESLDYESRTFYQYNVTAWDTSPDEANGINHAVPVDFFVTVLDVQDTPPFFRNLPYIQTIDENVTIGTSVLTVLAEDGDLGVAIPHKLKYYFVDSDTDSNSFSINSEGGEVTTGQLLDADSNEMKQKGGVLSFNVNASEVITGTISNQEEVGETSSITKVTIYIRDVNDNRPNFTSDVINATVFENTPIGVPLTLQNTVEVEDIDMTSENNLFELSVENNGSPYDDFDTIPGENQPVSSSNIMIRVRNSTLLDYEERTKVTFQIVARESQSQEKLSSTVDVIINIINVNDESPVFESNHYTFNISEDADVNDVLGQVEATDADLGTFGEVSYEMEDGNADFNISKTDGRMTVAKKLNREERSSYSLLVYAYDNADVGRRTGQTRVEIKINDVNDNAPVFAGNTLIIPIVENADVDSLVTTVTATDKDEGTNGEIEYFIHEDNNATGRFAVNSSNGVVTVAASLVSYTGIRFITVGARDKGQPTQYAYQDLVFSIRDVNLNKPNFTHPEGEFNLLNRAVFEVWEEQPIGSTIITLVATDDDVGHNGEVIYRIEAGHDSEKFRVGLVNGSLWNNDLLNREERETYEIQVVAQDNGNPPLSTTLPITVKLLDIDDNDPYFPDKTFPDRVGSISVLEGTTGCINGSDVNVAEDIDAWENNTVRCYYMKGGDQPFTTYINLNKTTGAVCLTQKLDREISPIVNVLIMVSRDCSLTGSPEKPFDSEFDKGNRSILHFKVNVEDINDNPPVFADNGTLSTGILYDTVVNEIIYNLRDEVTDADQGSNAVTYFRDLGQTGTDIDDVGNGAFTVSVNGSITTNRLFSSTMLGYIEISVEAYDIGNLTDRATLKIYIISNLQRVKIIFNKQPDEVRKIRSEFVRELEEFLDYKIIVEKIASHELPDKSTVDGRTDMFIHAVYDNGELVPATELWRAFDFTKGISLIFAKYGVTETLPVVDDATPDDDTSRNLMMGLILVAVVLSLIALSLAISLYCIRQKYARRLRAERTTVTHFEKEEAPPGTNLYTAASNPVFMKEDLRRVEDDEISLNLDDNAVDDVDNFENEDEQEMTITIDGPEALRTMTKASVLEDVLNRYAEVEKAKGKGDKQSLIDEHSSDGDSGTYTSIKGLEQSDI